MSLENYIKGLEEVKENLETHMEWLNRAIEEFKNGGDGLTILIGSRFTYEPLQNSCLEHIFGIKDINTAKFKLKEIIENEHCKKR